MAETTAVDTYLHIDGFDNWQRDAFDKRRIRAGMRRAGIIVTGAAQLGVALARGAGNYPVSRTGRLVQSIHYRVSRAGFLVKIAPRKLDTMRDYYPAYLHYGVKAGARVGRLAAGAGLGKSNRRAKGARVAAQAARSASGWRIAPRDNYIADALQDKRSRVQDVLRQSFAAALG